MTTRPVRLFPILFLCLAAPRAVAEAGDYPSDSPWRVRPAQAVLGVLGGTCAAVLGGVAGYLIMPPCVYDYGEEGSEKTSRPCGSLGVLGGIALGAIAGTSGGIYAVGRGSGHRGSFLATAGGAAGGLMAGVLLAGSMQAKSGATFTVLAASTTLSGLAAYHFTDRVRMGVSAVPERPSPGVDPPGAPSAPALRPEVRATVRF